MGGPFMEVVVNLIAEAGIGRGSGRILCAETLEFCPEVMDKEFADRGYFYSFNMFHSLDYLIEKESGPLRGLPMVQPITGFAMKGYYLWIRCSKSSHQGRPFLQFYNNGSYYDKFMNRRTAWKDQNGRTHWSTMLDEENRITDSMKKENPEDES
jgi:hypothetical protein